MEGDAAKEMLEGVVGGERDKRGEYEFGGGREGGGLVERGWKEEGGRGKVQ